MVSDTCCDLWRCPVQDGELDLMILTGPSQLRKCCDSMGHRLTLRPGRVCWGWSVLEMGQCVLGMGRMSWARDTPRTGRRAAPARGRPRPRQGHARARGWQGWRPGGRDGAELSRAEPTVHEGAEPGSRAPFPGLRRRRHLEGRQVRQGRLWWVRAAHARVGSVPPPTNFPTFAARHPLALSPPRSVQADLTAPGGVPCGGLGRCPPRGMGLCSFGGRGRGAELPLAPAGTAGGGRCRAGRDGAAGALRSEPQRLGCRPH